MKLNLMARLACLVLGTFVMVGCEEKGPAEKAGESIDAGVKKAQDAVDPRGPAEKAGAAVDNAVNK
ncbi:hypothetical protein [Singulisphaera sp. PoT]|uniref:hypothetical protein n=1 Tax=Singulisphaera sp. PoT TaxID=3411797 RepID=UPI003BF4C940